MATPDVFVTGTVNNASPLWKLLVNVREAAEILSMGRTAVFEEIRRGRLKTVKRGRARLIPVDCLNEFVNLLKAEGDQASTA